MANILLVESCLSEDILLVEEEEEVWAEFIGLIELLYFKKMEFILDALVISKLLKHIEKKVNWHKTVSEVGLFAVTCVGLDSNDTLLLV